MKQLIPAASGKAKYDIVLKITYRLFDVDNQEAVAFAEQAYSLAMDLGDSLEMTKSGRLFGQLLRRVDRPDEAIARFNEVLPVAERNQFLEEEKKILNALAIAFNFKAMFDKALQVNFKSLEIREKEGNKSDIALALSNIGFVYYKMGDFEQALDYFKRTLELKLQTKDNSFLDQTYINISLCYIYLNDHDQAKKFVYKGFDVCGDNCSDQIRIEGEFCLGRSFLAINDFEKAEFHFKQSYSIANKIGDRRFLAENSFQLGSISIANKNYDSAIKLLSEVENLAKISGYNQILINAYLEFSKLFNQTKNFEKAALYQSKYIHLKDSIYSEDLIKNLARVQTEYAERENIKTIAEQSENIRLKEEIITRQRQIYVFLGVIVVLAVGLAIVSYLFSRNTVKTKAQLAMFNKTLEKRVEERTKELQNVNNELDNFIYKTSHDIRGPLASLKGIANVALLELDDPKAKDYLRKLDASADKLNTILTRLLIVNQINHAVMAPQKIEFEELIREILVFERKKGIPPSMSVLHEIDSDVELVTDRHLLRIILENLIDNAIKYHNTSERIEPFVKIKAELKNGGVLVKVIDNGIGIQERDPQKLFQMFVRASERSESGGIGLYLTKLASERILARVDFATTAEKFTQFSVLLPHNLEKALAEKQKGVEAEAIMSSALKTQPAA